MIARPARSARSARTPAAPLSQYDACLLAALIQAGLWDDAISRLAELRAVVRRRPLPLSLDGAERWEPKLPARLLYARHERARLLREEGVRDGWDD